MASKTFYECGCMVQGDQEFLCETHKTKVSDVRGDAGRGSSPLLGGASPDQPRRLAEIRARLDAWREHCDEEGGNHDFVAIFHLHAAADIAWLLGQLVSAQSADAVARNEE